jgi:hypothetical protein
VKLETKSREGKRVGLLDAQDHLQIMRDLSPLLAEKGIPAVDETVWGWAIRRLRISGFKDERGVQRN